MCKDWSKVQQEFLNFKDRRWHLAVKKVVPKLEWDGIAWSLFQYHLTIHWKFPWELFTFPITFKNVGVKGQEASRHIKRISNWLYELASRQSIVAHSRKGSFRIKGRKRPQFFSFLSTSSWWSSKGLLLTSFAVLEIVSSPAFHHHLSHTLWQCPKTVGW